MTNEENLSTAYQEWDRRWADAENWTQWLKPEEKVVEAIPLLKDHGVRRVLDIGCGMGRHAIYLSQQGFEVTGLDASASGIDFARNAAAQAELTIDLHIGDFTALPFQDENFDFALAWNVLYHGDGEIAKTAFREIRRILSPGGLVLATMISQRHHRYGDGREIRPDTFIVDDDDEKAHAHFYSDDRALLDLLEGFQILQLEDRDQRGTGEFHWEFIAERRDET
jgi:tellurite methyltransferase